MRMPYVTLLWCPLLWQAAAHAMTAIRLPEGITWPMVRSCGGLILLAKICVR